MTAIKEVDMHLNDDTLPLKSSSRELNDPLKWWKINRQIYPNLASIVRTHCNVVATSVPCERIFSKSGLILDDRRMRLTTQKVQQLMFLNVNMDEKRFHFK